MKESKRYVQTLIADGCKHTSSLTNEMINPLYGLLLSEAPGYQKTEIFTEFDDLFPDVIDYLLTGDEQNKERVFDKIMKACSKMFHDKVEDLFYQELNGIKH